MWQKIGNILRTLLIIFIVAAAILIASSIYEWWQGKATVVGMATIVAGAAAAISVFYLAEQIRTSVEQLKVSRSHEFIMKFHHPDFLKTAVKARNLLKNRSTSSEEKQKELDADPEKKTDVVAMLGFFEGLGALYNKDKLDKALIREFFTEISIVAYNEAFDPFIKEIQDHAPTAYANWKHMNSDFEKNRESILKK